MKKNCFIDLLFICIFIIFSWGNPNFIEDNLLIILIIAVFIQSVISLGVILKRRNLEIVIRNNILVLLIILFCFISAIYSTQVQITIRQSIVILFLSIASINLCILYNEEDILRIICIYTLISMIFSMIILIISPLSALTIAHGDILGLQGVFGHKNGLGRVMLIGFIIMKYYSEKYEVKIYKYIKFICIPFILFSKSTTILILMLIYFIYKVYAKRNKYRIVKISNFVFISGFIVLVIFNDQLSNSIIGEVFYNVTGKSIQLTGRIPIWEFMLKCFEQSPFIGYGYAAFWENNDFIYSMLHSTQSSIPVLGSHNGYLDILLNLGLIGFAILIGLLIQAYKMNKYKNDYSIHVLSIILISNLFENALLSNSIFWILIVCFANKNLITKYTNL